VDGWSNIFRFTENNNDLKELGDRVIALFLNNENKVHLVIENDNDKNWHINSIAF